MINFWPFFSYPREPAQGAAFEKIIGPVDLILYFECSNVSQVTCYLSQIPIKMT